MDMSLFESFPILPSPVLFHVISSNGYAVYANKIRLMPSTPQPASPSGLHDAIRRRAEEIYVRNGKLPGRDAENWSQAEAEILTELSAATRRTAIVVRVEGVQYVGEYNAAASQGYTPGEFRPGAPVPVRLEGDKMFVIRRNGKELETSIVQREPQPTAGL